MAGKVVDKDRGQKRILQQLKGVDGWRVTIGVHGQEAPREGEIDNIGLAVIHEFGAPSAGIPERSFLRAAFDANVRKYLKLLLRGARAIARGRSTPKRALGITGEVAVADVVNLINAGIPPPNAPATIEAKGSSTPLIDTGALKQSIKPVVEKK
jgi:hypothetical protein